MPAPVSKQSDEQLKWHSHVGASLILTGGQYLSSHGKSGAGLIRPLGAFSFDLALISIRLPNELRLSTPGGKKAEPAPNGGCCAVLNYQAEGHFFPIS